MGFRPRTLRDWVVVAFTAAGVALLPWTVWLSSSLSPHHVTNRWDLAWSGFDTGLAVLFIATAFAAYRRSPWVGAFAAALGTMLVADAWFDVILESHADELRFSIMLAVFLELPAAAVCFWLAHRTERLLAKAVEEAEGLHLPPARQGSAEGDLVGVFEVPADGESAGEPGHSDSTA
jgi:hypothetical protein